MSNYVCVTEVTTHVFVSDINLFFLAQALIWLRRSNFEVEVVQKNVRLPSWKHKARFEIGIWLPTVVM